MLRDDIDNVDPLPDGVDCFRKPFGQFDYLSTNRIRIEGQSAKWKTGYYVLSRVFLKTNGKLKCQNPNAK